MKYYLPAYLLLCSVIAAPALADSNVDWGGGYGGVSLSNLVGHITYTFDEEYRYEFSKDQDGGLHFGYRWDQGTYVGGIEVSYVDTVLHELDPEDGEVYEDYRFNGLLDVKVSGGYKYSSAFLYGTLGMARANYVTPYRDDKLDGILLGLGVAYQVNDRFSIGAEYNWRSLEGVLDDHGESDTTADLNGFEVRASYHF